MTAFSDVSDVLRTAHELRVSERRYHAVLRATHDVIWELDPKSGRVVWNAALERVFGHSPEDASRHPQGGYGWWLDHVHPDDRARHARELRTGARRRAPPRGRASTASVAPTAAT